jgi:8-oxo-dGTP pyrophosphatase MutT (NUDIX family)
MLKIHDPASARNMSLRSPDFWLLVGGGVQPGETYEQAAVREVFEETGITEVVLGPCIWTADYTAAWHDGQPRRVIQKYFAARVPTGIPVTFAGHEPLEALTTVGYEWFTLADILDRETTESFRPPGLGGLLSALLRRGQGEDPPEPKALSI